MHWFTICFLGALTGSVLLRLWLNFRQFRHIRAHIDTVPTAFADKITLKDHQRAANYSCTKLTHARIELAWDSLWLLLWTLGGGIALIDQWWLSLGFSPLLSGILVIFSLLLVSAIVNLPFSLYQTFVFEEGFGFNQTSFATWSLDLVKTMLLLGLLGIPLVAAILWLMSQAGSNWWLYTWVLWMTFSLIMVWAYPTFIAPLFNQFKPLQDGELLNRIEDLLQRCGASTLTPDPNHSMFYDSHPPASIRIRHLEAIGGGSTTA